MTITNDIIWASKPLYMDKALVCALDWRLRLGALSLAVDASGESGFVHGVAYRTGRGDAVLVIRGDVVVVCFVCNPRELRQ